MKKIEICGRELAYIQKRSDRRSVSASVSEDGVLVIRTPRWVNDRYVREFICANSARISVLLDKKSELEKFERYLATSADKLMESAMRILPERVRRYSEIMGVNPTAVKVNNAKTRFGSCSSEGSINFSYRLMAYSDNAINYVVVHELAHLLYMDHGTKFWETVEKYMPHYKAARSELRSVPTHIIRDNEKS